MDSATATLTVADKKQQWGSFQMGKQKTTRRESFLHPHCPPGSPVFPTASV